MHAYMHICMHAYVHTYIHTDIYIYIFCTRTLSRSSTRSNLLYNSLSRTQLFVPFPQYGEAQQPTPNAGRLLLHAHSLQIEHPELGTPLRFVAPLPADYLAELSALGLDLSEAGIAALASGTATSMDSRGVYAGLGSSS